MSSFDFFLAERATRDIQQYDEPQAIDLSEFEKLLVDIADCVLISPEGAGSFVELGLFSAFDAALPKVLLANDSRHQGYSFINEGPRRWIDQKSIFNGTIYLDYGDGADRTDAYRTLCSRLHSRLGEKKTGKRFPLDRFNRLSPHQQLLLVISIIDLLRIPSIDDIASALRKICGGGYRRGAAVHGQCASGVTLTEYSVRRVASDASYQYSNLPT